MEVSGQNDCSRENRPGKRTPSGLVAASFKHIFIEIIPERYFLHHCKDSKKKENAVQRAPFLFSREIISFLSSIMLLRSLISASFFPISFLRELIVFS